VILRREEKGEGNGKREVEGSCVEGTRGRGGEWDKEKGGGHTIVMAALKGWSYRVGKGGRGEFTSSRSKSLTGTSFVKTILAGMKLNSRGTGVDTDTTILTGVTLLPPLFLAITLKICSPFVIPPTSSSSTSSSSAVPLNTPVLESKVIPLGSLLALTAVSLKLEAVEESGAKDAGCFTKNVSSFVVLWEEEEYFRSCGGEECGRTVRVMVVEVEALSPVLVAMIV
jgi:hypothetical protein